jgi:hypothetical protein
MGEAHFVLLFVVRQTRSVVNGGTIFLCNEDLITITNMSVLRYFESGMFVIYGMGRLLAHTTCRRSTL